MSWDVVLFDLDGTLTDSGLGVGNGVLYTLEKMGYPKPSDAELKKYLGPPLWTSFQDYAGMPESDTPEAVRLYREYYNETGAYENSVYPGIPELLKRLTEAGKRVAVATSKVDYGFRGFYIPKPEITIMIESGVYFEEFPIITSQCNIAERYLS